MIQRIEELRIKGALEQQIAALIKVCFRADFNGRSFCQNRHHCRFVEWRGETLAGHLAIAYRAIRLGEDLVDIVGIGEVAVAPEFRRQGIGRQLVEAALEEGRTAKADYAILFGEESIYAKAGFVNAPNEFTIVEMNGANTQDIRRRTDPNLMVMPLGDRPWNPDAPVDLAGFPF